MFRPYGRTAPDLARRRGFADAPRIGWTATSDTGRLTIPRCKARRRNDQMQCQCGLAWDVNDPEPPTCPNAVEFDDRLAVVMGVRVK